MAISFNPETLYKNAFHAFKRENSFLYKRDISKFCDLLSREIFKYAQITTAYKEVYMDINRYAISNYAKSTKSIFKIRGSRIYLNEDINEEEIERINGVYDVCIRKALEDTRNNFKEYFNKY